MTVTEKIDQFVAENGGSLRDALNVALVRLDQARLTAELAEKQMSDLNEEVEKLKADIEMISAGF